MLNLLFKLNTHLSSYVKKWLFLLLLLSIILSFAEAISLASIVPFIGVFLKPDIFYSHPWLNLFVNFFEIKNNDQLFLFVTIIFASLIILSGLIKLLFLHLSNKITQFIEAEIKTKIFKYNIHQSYAYHLEQSSYAVMSSLIQKTSTTASFVRSSINILGSLMTILFIMTVLIFLKPFIIISIASILTGFFVVVFFIYKNKLLKNSKKLTQNEDKIINIFQDSVGYISEIIVYSLQNIFISKFTKATYQVAKSKKYTLNVSESPRIYLEYVSLLSLAALIFYFNQSKSDVVNSLTVLAALGLGAQKMLPLINSIHNSISSMGGVQAGITDVINLLDNSAKVKNTNLFSKKIFLKKSFKLNNVYFSYNKKNNWILKNINLEIKKGSKVGIKGTTGSGKSTLVNIIIGLLDPTKGQLFIDDVLINSQNKLAWQKNISIIPQNIFLNDVSIAENIAIGVEPKEINLEKVKKAARQAQIHTYIESAPNQYNETVGERGIKLSGGQRQRIGIARALYREAKIILFDEATNQLDVDTETLIMDSIYSLDKEITVILIAHRLSTLERCDKIIDLSKDFSN
jgi:ABC-type multidrug transport system fused ATPase/permease subunit